MSLVELLASAPFRLPPRALSPLRETPSCLSTCLPGIVRANSAQGLQTSVGSVDARNPNPAEVRIVNACNDGNCRRWLVWEKLCSWAWNMVISTPFRYFREKLENQFEDWGDCGRSGGIFYWADRSHDILDLNLGEIRIPLRIQILLHVPDQPCVVFSV